MHSGKTFRAIGIGLLLVSSAPIRSAAFDSEALPLGDGKYASEPKMGYLYPCFPDKFYHIGTGARAGGSWIHGSTWNPSEKPSVSGEVFWPNANFAISNEDGMRHLAGNDLPIGQKTGTFPTQASDLAYKYDPNPNPITPQLINLLLPRNPTIASAPSCVELPVAIGLDGVIFFSALDSHGRDEPAYEMQDRCGGMSAPNGMYHRYRPSDCMPHIYEKNALVGYALDGFGIFSPYDANGKELTTRDLDKCHGTTTPIMWDGKHVTMYHYVLTRDFPYSIGCFRGIPAHIPLPPPPENPSFFTALWNFILWHVAALFSNR
jgi:hypothetical protein